MLANDECLHLPSTLWEGLTGRLPLASRFYYVSNSILTEVSCGWVSQGSMRQDFILCYFSLTGK